MNRARDAGAAGDMLTSGNAVDLAARVNEALPFRSTHEMAAAQALMTVDPSLVEYLSAIYRRGQQEEQQTAATRETGLSASSGLERRNSDRGERGITPLQLANALGLGSLWRSIRRFSVSPVTDCSETFRLYFGTNITIFPFLVLLGGAAGAICCSFPVAWLLLEGVSLQLEAKRVAVDVVLKELVALNRREFLLPEFQAANNDTATTTGVVGGGGGAVAIHSPSKIDFEKQTHDQRLKALDEMCARHVAVNTYFRLSEILWTYPKRQEDLLHHHVDSLSNVGSPMQLLSHRSSVTHADRFHELQPRGEEDDVVAVVPQDQSERRSAVASPGDSDVARKIVMSDTDTAGEVVAATASATAVIRSPPSAASVVEVEMVSVYPTLVRLVVFLAQYISASAFTMLLASNLYALASDVLSLSASLFITCVLLAFLLTILGPRSLAVFAAINNVALLFSVVLLVLATVLHVNGDSTPSGSSNGDRVWLFSPSLPQLLMFFPLLVGYTTPALFVIDVETNIARRCIQVGREGILAQLRGDTTSSSPATPPPNVPHVDALLSRFRSLNLLALGAAFVVLLGFGEFIFSNFLGRTNAVVALTLRPGRLQTLLLLDLTVGISACAALNLLALPNMLADLNLASRCGCGGSRTVVLVERILLNAAAMGGVLITLLVVPFFDLVASLGGALGVNGFTFFLPVLLRLQAARRELEAAAKIASTEMSILPPFLGGDAGGSRGTPRTSIGWIAAFRSLPSKRTQVSMCLMLSIGTAMLISGVSNFFVQFAARLARQGSPLTS